MGDIYLVEGTHPGEDSSNEEEDVAYHEAAPI